MATRMQQRRGTAAQWAAANPVLADGEFGFETDTGVVKVGNASSTWNQLPPILNGTFLPVGGKAYDSDRLDGLDSTAFTKPADLTSLARDLGTGTTWPTTGPSSSALRRGDTYYHTAVAQLGVYTGAAWRLIGPGTVATIVARDALTWAYKGMEVIVTADGLMYEYQNTFLGWTRPWNQAWGELLSVNLALSQNATGGYVEYGAGIVGIPKGRKLRIRGRSFWYSGTSSATTIRTRFMVYRDLNATPTTLALTGIDMDRRIGPGSGGDLAWYTYDTPYTTGGTYAGSAKTRFAFQGQWANTAPSSALYTAGNADEQNFFAVVDVGPATPPPSS